jgi:tRNA-modifying protein YgfZ
METAKAEPWELVDALDDGRGFVDRSQDRVLLISGADSRGWLGDLVTADVATLGPGSSRRSLLLTPTGRIRADVWITQTDDTFVVSQANDQPEPIEDLLHPYVLSSAVRLEDATGVLSAMAFPARGEIVTVPRAAPVATLDRTMAGRGAVPVDERSYEVWRVWRGDPRMGADFDAGALPAEAGLERLIDLTKGCFLGQESVAKVRNLGHPPTVLRHLRSRDDISRGAPVQAAGEAVGKVTSVAPGRHGGSVLIARVEWDAAEAALHAGDDSRLFPLAD